MEVGEVSTLERFGPGSQVVVRMDGGVTVEGTVDFTVSPVNPETDEPFCVVKVPIPLSKLRRP